MRIRHLVLTLLAVPAAAQEAALDARSTWAADLAAAYAITPDVTYHAASGVELKLDLYVPRGLTGPNPTVLAFHGGGWVSGTKDAYTLAILPFLERGFTVVNVGYRLARVAPAPAAVEDGRCALRWLALNAERHRFDLDRVVVTGGSAGGHLALTTGLLRGGDGLDATCATAEDVRWTSGAEPPMKVAAIVNWFGITDVADLLAGENAKHYAIEWIGAAAPDRMALARRVSPLTYVRPGSPPVFTVHGDADTLVPHAHAVRLHQALEKVGVANRLVSITKGGHGGFAREDRHRIFASMFAFLAERGLLPAR